MAGRRTKEAAARARREVRERARELHATRQDRKRAERAAWETGRLHRAHGSIRMGLGELGEVSINERHGGYLAAKRLAQGTLEARLEHLLKEIEALGREAQARAGELAYTPSWDDV
jgi:hypothetical protein